MVAYILKKQNKTVIGKVIVAASPQHCINYVRFYSSPVEVNHIHNIERIRCVARHLTGNITLFDWSWPDTQRMKQDQEKKNKVLSVIHLSAGSKYLSLQSLMVNTKKKKYGIENMNELL